ncbi:hypothetical protein [Nocardia sp. X0981]
MGGKRDVWQQITQQVKAADQRGNQDIVFSPAAGEKALYALEAASGALGTIIANAEELSVQNAEFGDVSGSLAGWELKNMLVEQKSRLVDALKELDTAFGHMQDMFFFASRQYRRTEAESAAAFMKLGELPESARKDYSFDDQGLRDRVEADRFGQSDRGASGEIIDPEKEGFGAGEVKHLKDAPPPGSGLLAPALARLADTIDHAPLEADARLWFTMSTQVAELLKQFSRDMNAAFDSWSGPGQKAAANANKAYVAHMKDLSQGMNNMGKVLAYFAGWLWATWKNMPVDGEAERSYAAARHRVEKFKTNGGALKTLPVIRVDYENLYMKPMAAAWVPVIPEFTRKSGAAQPKPGTEQPKADTGDRKPGSPGAGPQGGPANTPQNGSPGPTGQTDKLKQGFEKLDAAQKNLQKNADRIAEGAQRIKDGQTNIGQGAQLIAQGNQLMQQAQQASAAGRTQEAAALMAQGRRLIAEGKDKVAEGRTQVTAGQRAMRAALTEIKTKDAKEIARAEKALREAGQALPAEQRKSVDQALAKAEKFRESTTDRAEELTKDFTEAGDRLLKDSKDLVNNPGTADPAATLAPGSTADPATTPAQPAPTTDPGDTTTPPELAATAQPADTAAPNTPGPVGTAPAGATTPAAAVPGPALAPGTTAPGLSAPAATPQAGLATPLAGQDPLSGLAGVAQQVGSFVQQAGQGLTNLFHAGALPNMPLPGVPDIPAALRDLAAGAPPGGLGGGGGGGAPGAGPAAIPGQPLEPPREYGPKVSAREGGTPIPGGEPRAGVPAGYQQPMMGSPGAPGAGTGQGGQDGEHKRPKFLQSTEHLEEALGEAPAVYKAVIDR